MTGAEGMKHTQRMLAGGSNIVGGVNPRKAGETVEVEGKSLPVFGSVADAMSTTGANVSVIFVPPAFAKAAIIEAIDAEIPLAVAITEGIPVHDSATAWAYNVEKGAKTRLIGPNCPGIISPGQSNAGITPWNITERPYSSMNCLVSLLIEILPAAMSVRTAAVKTPNDLSIIFIIIY